MLRILLINDTPRKVGRLRAALIEAGFEVIDESGLTIDLPARVETVQTMRGRWGAGCRSTKRSGSPGC